jgi:HTH-type transcriptional regulator/antitoxin HipB
MSLPPGRPRKPFELGPITQTLLEIDLYINFYRFLTILLMYKSIMKTLQELGEAVAAARRELRLKQKEVAAQAGITPELLLRFERGQVTEFGARKLLAVLAVLGMEVAFVKAGMSGSLDELRRERGGV